MSGGPLPKTRKHLVPQKIPNNNSYLTTTPTTPSMNQPPSTPKIPGETFVQKNESSIKWPFFGGQTNQQPINQLAR